MRRWIAGVALLAAFAAPAHAQDEFALRNAFEGRKVVVKLDLPASSSGINVYPQRRPALDFPTYGKQIKRYGTALREGERVLVTKIRVKKDLIEFQLAGGGYGTFEDDTNTDHGVAYAEKTQREKNLEEDLKHEKDPAKRRQKSEELDALRKERERENARNHATVQAADEEAKQNLTERRLAGGSRINVRFTDRVPDGALTPQGLEAALEEWVDFDASQADDAIVEGSSTSAPGGIAALRKGLTRAEVDALLGPATRVTPLKEGTLAVENAEYAAAEDVLVTAVFVEGVLVKYSIASH